MDWIQARFTSIDRDIDWGVIESDRDIDDYEDADSLLWVVKLQYSFYYKGEFEYSVPEFGFEWRTLNQVFELKELDEDAILKVRLLIAGGEKPAHAMRVYDEVTYYQCMNDREFGIEMADMLSDIPSHIKPYIDWEARWRDLATDYYQATIDGLNYYFTY